MDCLLPLFDRKTATGVAELLMKGATSKDADEGEDGGGGLGRRVLFDPIPLHQNPAIARAVWDRFAAIPSVTIPKKNVKPIRRLTALATALSKDHLLDEAVEKAHKHLHAVLDGAPCSTRRRSRWRASVLTMEGEEVEAESAAILYRAFSVSADPRAIEDYYRTATRILSQRCAPLCRPPRRTGRGRGRSPRSHITIASLGLVRNQAVGMRPMDYRAVANADSRRTQGAERRTPGRVRRAGTMSTTPGADRTPAKQPGKVRHPDGTEEDLPTEDACSLRTTAWFRSR